MSANEGPIGKLNILDFFVDIHDEIAIKWEEEMCGSLIALFDFQKARILHCN